MGEADLSQRESEKFTDCIALYPGCNLAVLCGPGVDNHNHFGALFAKKRLQFIIFFAGIKMPLTQ
jgi:hypothetical protein